MHRAAPLSIREDGEGLGVGSLLSGCLLLLPLELVLVLLDELADLVRHPEQAVPLLRVEGDGEASESVDADAALLTDLERACPFAGGLQLLVLGTELFEFGLEFFG